jgi:hypothetical protein
LSHPEEPATERFDAIDVTFASLFSKPVWDSALVLLVGATLAPGKRTVNAILWMMELEQVAQFQKYHQVSIVLHGLLYREASCYCSS